MKKLMLSGFVTSLLAAPFAAFAAEGDVAVGTTPLASQGYVNAGLKAVLSRAKTAAADAQATADEAKQIASTNAEVAGALATVIGDENSGMYKSVEDLKVSVGDNESGLVKRVNDLANTVANTTNTYTGVNGVVVNEDDRTIKLDVESTGANENNMYVFKNGQWTALPVTDAWNDSFLDE